ncbi:hypothetical protein [Actinoplanes sp. NPDC049118]|uniref:hypothetical protein n=1 Tax=Actinoplanes sp. NPDC049118 TaxID=3155769 RepID=UPI0033F6D71E
MRRLLSVTAVSGALLLLGTGCSSGKAAENTTAAPLPAISTPAAASAPAAGASAGAALPGEADAALSGNTAAICQQAAKTGGDAAKNFAQDLKLLIDAESSQDKDLVLKAKQKTARDVENYSFALKDMSKLAADAKLKAALADMGSQVTALKGDVRKINAERLAKLQATLDKACGNG